MPDLPCGVAMNRLALVGPMSIPPGALRQLIKYFNYIAFGCWFLSLLVLLARIFFVIDFQLVRVTVKTIEFERGDETTSFQVVEVDQSGNGEATKLATTQC